jgi:RNA polymerase sigma-70 factor (ECF subfamily)
MSKRPTTDSTWVTPTFESVYTAEARRLTAALALSAGSRDLAEDIVSEAFVRALERWPRVSAMESPAGWIYTVAVNLLRRRWRRQALEHHLFRRLLVPDTQLIDVDPDLWEAVASLPPRARAAVGLRYIGDMTERQVADVLGVSPGTVAATLHQARRRLAERLSPNADSKEGSTRVHESRSGRP